MSFSEQSTNQRRRAPPQAVAIGTRIQNSYRGKVIKKRIERNQISKIKRKFFKSVKPEANAAEAPGESSARAVSQNTAESKSGNSRLSQRANPFHKLLKERDAVRQRKDDERKQREQEISQAEAGRNKYLQHRKSQQKKHTSKTARGQPALSKQIGGLLQKIKKDHE
ncbi:hypothetical protein GGI04_000257 [Coemansia thaxteri]|uniref:rRNA-processing protein FYV7 n=1 Tax=Coemansia thaxteri TaxID=2663907 RepID=A0A9W8EHD5_9FUNG|nr:hypothetical protein H4R26_000588 [Coemansia thaxteri]KAJ2009685.1 hypothetical protein GGI04_000257 [Coemansia thaxteri]KAJ2474338.1 hypothetical protein GGI02_000135 [Coemansia sp. RSA 2322]KAJ2486222.1 hypothetical protein EV174_001242 [Coemansia sp. RSA 2320]